MPLPAPLQNHVMILKTGADVLKSDQSVDVFGFNEAKSCDGIYEYYNVSSNVPAKKIYFKGSESSDNIKMYYACDKEELAPSSNQKG